MQTRFLKIFSRAKIAENKDILFKEDARLLSFFSPFCRVKIQKMTELRDEDSTETVYSDGLNCREDNFAHVGGCECFFGDMDQPITCGNSHCTKKCYLKCCHIRAHALFHPQNITSFQVFAMENVHYIFSHPVPYFVGCTKCAVAGLDQFPAQCQYAGVFVVH